MNPLMITLLPFLIYGLASHAMKEIRGRAPPEIFLPAVWIHALGIVIILFGIARNLSLHPLDLLAPGAMHP